MKLNTGEVAALQHALYNHDFLQGITVFFASEAEEARKQCCDAMQAPTKIELGIAAAARASAAEQLLNHLEAFVKENL